MNGNTLISRRQIKTKMAVRRAFRAIISRSSHNILEQSLMNLLLPQFAQHRHEKTAVHETPSKWYEPAPTKRLPQLMRRVVAELIGEAL